MKTLNLHCDYIKFQALKKALKSIDEIAPNQKLEGESKECLVVMVAVEKTDSLKIVPEFVESIEKIATDLLTFEAILLAISYSNAEELFNQIVQSITIPFYGN